jgi:DNA-binding MarR family transcriptional regulator
MAATRKAARLLTQLYDSHLSEHGIEGAQFALLMTIEAAGDKGQAAVAQAMGTDKTTLSRNLRVLTGRGWIEARPGNDARRRELSLTKEGRAVMLKARPAWLRAQEALRTAMGEMEWMPALAVIEGIGRAGESATRGQ